MPKKENVIKAIESLAGKFLTFELADEAYGLEILKVQEIIGIMKVTRVPKLPDYIKGVINLRGKVIPVVDLRLKFNMDSQEETEKTCIIVVQIQRGEAKVITGLMVDEVSEVMDISTEQIEEAPSFGASVSTDFLLGIGKVNDKVIMLMDVDEVLSADEIDEIATVD